MDSSSCPLCLEKNTSPLQFTGCSHKICTGCILKLIFYNHLKHFETDDSIDITCSLCNQGTVSLTLDQIASLSSKATILNKLFCSLHGLPAHSYCENCKSFLCNSCVSNHNENKMNHSFSKNFNETPNGNSAKMTLPFKYKTFEQYSESLNAAFANFEKKAKDHQTDVNTKIDSMIATLNKYKEDFSKDLNVKLNREKKVLNVFSNFYKRFYNDINNCIKNKEYKTLENLCNSLDRQFSTISVANISPINEDLDSLKEELDGYISSMKQFTFKYNFPAISRTYTNTKTLTGHSDKINCIAQLSNGDIASGGRDSVIRIWKMDSGYDNSITLKGHAGWVSTLLLLNTKELLSGSYDGTLKIWDPSNNFANTHTLTGHTSWVSSSIQFPNGTLISSSFDNTIIVRVGKNYKTVDVLKEHTFGVFALAQLPNNKFASGSGDKTIKVWNTERNVERTMKGHNATVNCLCYLKTENLLASGSGDKTIKIWDYETGECINTIKAHNDGVSCLCTLPDGRLVSGAEDNLIKIWDNENKYNNTHILKGHSNVINSIIIIDDKKILSASADKIMKIWTEERSIFSD